MEFWSLMAEKFNSSSLSLFHKDSRSSAGIEDPVPTTGNYFKQTQVFGQFFQETKSMPTFASKEEKGNLSFYSII